MSKRRYRTEDQILAAIDRNAAAIKVVGTEMDKLEASLAHYHVERPESWIIEDLERRVISSRRSLAIRSGRMIRLKEKLSEFRTPQLPVVDNGDVSVPC